MLPAIGFGTYQLNGAIGVESILGAIHSGYRLLDSAFNYENEGAIGQAVRRCGISREELCIASKLPGRHHRFREAIKTVEESLYRAQLDYYDLYLIHWPNPQQGLYIEAWQALIEARRRGLVRSIGVCNFLPEYLNDLIAQTGVAPSVNQIEMHPYFSQAEQRAFNTSHGIETEAWSPLGRASSVLQDPALVEIAERLDRSVSAVILRWHYQLGVVPLPKANSPERQRENLQIFDFNLDRRAMYTISALSRPEGRIANQDPALYEEL
jgi:diketogulonate reductase-like aldo/keto reductase